MVRGPDQLRYLTPNGARPIRVPRQLPLSVGVIVKEDGDESDDYHGDREWETELIWMCGKKESVACIDRGHPHHTTPTLEEGGGGEGRGGDGGLRGKGKHRKAGEYIKKGEEVEEEETVNSCISHN